MLQWDASTQYKSLSTVQEVFFGSTKQVVVELELTSDEDQLVFRRKSGDTQGWTEQDSWEEGYLKVRWGVLEEGENSSSSSEFDDIFDINYDVSQGAIG